MPQLWNHWFRNCKETHTMCREMDTHRGFQPKRLIRAIPPLNKHDELKWCLVFPIPAEPLEYVTLSHCWGSHQPYRLTDDNISTLQDESPFALLPETYQEAIQVTLSLGCHHIWIDSLCIIQGSRKDWLEQSPQMALIYGAARCNIAATWAVDGTKGCFNVRDPFTVENTTMTFGGNRYHITPSSLYDEDFLYSPLNSRGWVVQERCLSTRQLSFTRKQAYWECAELFASEQFPNGFPEAAWRDSESRRLPRVYSPSASLKPRLNYSFEDDNRQSWASLVEHFSECQFMHASDKMIAFASLAASRRRQTGDTYLAGLWRQDLDKQLLWRPVNLEADPNHRSLRRRSSLYQAPSWSWAAIDGSINVERQYSSFGSGNPLTRHISIVDIISATVKSDDPDTLHSFTSG
ncbi:heterokaryon incompatibility protein-domain-containing protein [Cladorrhinum sp. PSN332]|nr:heterokaryon incompatibility protein-domain-containing protein [Cladorrhinum sp. PSN332]